MNSSIRTFEDSFLCICSHDVCICPLIQKFPLSYLQYVSLGFYLNIFAEMIELEIIRQLDLL